MKKNNKKAAKNTAISLTAKKHNLKRASKIIGISYEDITAFLLIKKYIRPEKYGYSATALGIDSGCCVNTWRRRAILTIKGISKIASAFAY